MTRIDFKNSEDIVDIWLWKYFMKLLGSEPCISNTLTCELLMQFCHCAMILVLKQYWIFFWFTMNNIQFHSYFGKLTVSWKFPNYSMFCEMLIIMQGCQTQTGPVDPTQATLNWVEIRFFKGNLWFNHFKYKNFQIGVVEGQNQGSVGQCYMEIPKLQHVL